MWKRAVVANRGAITTCVRREEKPVSELRFEPSTSCIYVYSITAIGTSSVIQLSTADVEGATENVFLRRKLKTSSRLLACSKNSTNRYYWSKAGYTSANLRATGCNEGWISVTQLSLFRRFLLETQTAQQTEAFPRRICYPKDHYLVHKIHYYTVSSAKWINSSTLYFYDTIYYCPSICGYVTQVFSFQVF
jgi:hypothetical protein